jgi:hypothetical protein
VLGPAAAPLCGEVIAWSSVTGTWVHRSDDATAARVCNSSADGIAVLCTGALRDDTASFSTK